MTIEQCFAKAYWLAGQGVAPETALLGFCFDFDGEIKGSGGMVENNNNVLSVLGFILKFIIKVVSGALLTNALQ